MCLPPLEQNPEINPDDAHVHINISFLPPSLSSVREGSFANIYYKYMCMHIPSSCVYHVIITWLVSSRPVVSRGSRVLSRLPLSPGHCYRTRCWYSYQREAPIYCIKAHNIHVHVHILSCMHTHIYLCIQCHSGYVTCISNNCSGKMLSYRSAQYRHL